MELRESGRGALCGAKGLVGLRERDIVVGLGG